jgi:hypothetical protein
MQNTRWFLAAAAGLALSAASAEAASITGLNFSLDVDQLPNSVALVSGGFSSILGPIDGAIEADVRTGAINLENGSVLDFIFGTPVTNGVGADFVVIDGRFDPGAFDFSIDGGATFSSVGGTDFVDSGVTETLAFFTNTFRPFVASVDLSDFGLAAGTVFSTLRIRAIDPSGSGPGGLDLMGVASLPSSTAVVPLPGGFLLLASALAGFAAIRRRA